MSANEDDPVARDDRRRERRRRSRSGGRDAAAPTAQQPVREGPPTDGQGGSQRRAERAARALEGSRSTQVGWTEALRAREWAAPTADDLAEAEQEVVLVRRHYVPPEPLPVRQDRRPRRQR